MISDSANAFMISADVILQSGFAISSRIRMIRSLQVKIVGSNTSLINSVRFWRPPFKGGIRRAKSSSKDSNARNSVTLVEDNNKLQAADSYPLFEIW